MHHTVTDVVLSTKMREKLVSNYETVCYHYWDTLRCCCATQIAQMHAQCVYTTLEVLTVPEKAPMTDAGS